MKTAVISGGAGGLGRALSAGLQARGWRCVLLDLDVSNLERSSTQVPIACDLTNPAQLQAATQEILDLTPAIDLVIYNAGITHIGPFEALEDATLRRVFEINVFAAVAMARAFLKPVRAAHGTHLAISSVAGFSPLYHRTAYAASKHALEGFFASLRSEESPHGVRTLIAAPSFVATNIGNAQADETGIARPGSAGDGIDYMTPDDAASVILKGVERGAPMIPVGRVARLSWWINRLSPRLFQRLMERNIRDA
ncbi:SDR family NAD(P)-dependent oxidoreductase [Shimia aestuarii]|uniref:Short-chain dehydrogenase n=1 Tax=Shimia aestuarii TaxID=254406 RepID=A0A1I4QSZ8_9RHOB|nr:SDR family NAD(P)-dependent oxidoreductase [Shimia aestuarii]SFM43137.1 Short-chain dehydrogenase [Shimia aestuarii]